MYIVCRRTQALLRCFSAVGDIKKAHALCGYVPFIHSTWMLPHLAYEAKLCIVDKLDDVAYLGAIRHLFLNLSYGVEHAGLAVEYKAVGIGDVVLNLL